MWIRLVMSVLVLVRSTSTRCEGMLVSNPDCRLFIGKPQWPVDNIPEGLRQLSCQPPFSQVPAETQARALLDLISITQQALGWPSQSEQVA